MPSALAIISLSHPSGEPIAATYAVDFTKEEIHKATIETCDPREVEDWCDKQGLLDWAQMMFDGSPRAYDDLFAECLRLDRNGETY